jgi:hypothetical protein
MNSAEPELDTTAQNVLREIYNRGVIRGAELAEISRIDQKSLQVVLEALLKSSLVATSGSGFDPLRSYFTIQPSVVDRVRRIIGK